MTARQLTVAFDRWRASGQDLVLATVYETAGSTYSKAGAQMLINGDGDFQGMLSGGCLEGDLAERSRQVLESGRPQLVTYDLGQNDEELWGLGVGCDGLMRIFLQPLRAANNYEPFTSMVKAFAGDTIELSVTVLESRHDRYPPGVAVVTNVGQVAFTDMDVVLATKVKELSTEVRKSGRSRMLMLNEPGGDVRILFALLQPPPRVLVLGAGLDAEPVVRLIGELGWRVIVQDHRPAYIAAGSFDNAEQVHCVPVELLASTVDFSRINAVIVMSHHLATDRAYLETLVSTQVAYIGVLGPPNRRARLIADIGDKAMLLNDRVHGPAGIDIGASGPASIALSIVAQMHLELMR